MEPTDPTSESLENLERSGHEGLRAELLSAAEQVTRIIPTLVGISLTNDAGEGPMTLVATTADVLPLDAIQYLTGGPCVDAVRTAAVVEVADNDPLNETQWSSYARTAAARGVRSSLSLPMMYADQVVGSANVYASQPGAFAGHVDAVADILGAWAPGAVADADLAFDTRRRALETARELRRRHRDVERAVQIVAELIDVSPETARANLVESAVRAGISLAAVAHTIVVFHG